MGTLVLTAEQLGEGVLLGRADRCWNLGEVPLPSTLSRVHALLLYEAEQLRVTDLASTNGTTLDGEPIRSAHWETGQLLVLGGELELEPLFIGPASEA
jgi:pSer/pThr/pTyr-binding forkhead associated (FHA) protein